MIDFHRPDIMQIDYLEYKMLMIDLQAVVIYVHLIVILVAAQFILDHKYNVNTAQVG